MGIPVRGRKEIHIFLDFIHNYPSDILKYGYYVGVSHSRAQFQRDVEEDRQFIFTSQTSACQTRYIEMGYRIFVYLLDHTVVELKYGSVNGSRVIREAHNLEKMLLSGTFGQANTDNYEDRLNKIFDELKMKIEKG